MINLQHEIMLSKADKSILDNKDMVKGDKYRQKYHFMAPAYWINDPNGLIYFKGEYHMFYQHYPYAPKWGAMHWGHAKSKDLVHWEHLPIALAPSEKYDLDERGGCFSGSAVDDDGVLSLLYTGTIIRDNKVIQTQCLATSKDGVNFTKYEGNPVIAEPPADGSADFRDPKVWKHEGKWYAVIGSSKDSRAKALLYRSENLKEWEYVGVMAESDGSLGTMWECPDFFPLGGRHILVCSPMGMGNKKVIYMVGDMDYETGKFTWDTVGEVDCGFEYYAPQSFMDGHGRRILIAWANGWDWMPWWKDFGPTHTGNWCGAMSVPREAVLCKDGRLSFRPVKELESLRTFQFAVKNHLLEPGDRFLHEEIGGACLEIIAEFELTDCYAEEFGFMLRLSPHGRKSAVVSYNVKSGELRFDRNNCDMYSTGICTCKVEAGKDNILKLHIYMDSSSVEIFADDYRTAMSNNIYPDPYCTGIDLFSKGASVMVKCLKIWKLKSIW